MFSIGPVPSFKKPDSSSRLRAIPRWPHYFILFTILSTRCFICTNLRKALISAQAQALLLHEEPWARAAATAADSSTRATVRDLHAQVQEKLQKNAGGNRFRNLRREADLLVHVAVEVTGFTNTPLTSTMF
jgi:hypothetical protein